MMIEDRLLPLNFRDVSESTGALVKGRLFRSAAPAPHGLAGAHHAGVRVAVDLRTDAERRAGQIRAVEGVQVLTDPLPHVVWSEGATSPESLATQYLAVVESCLEAPGCLQHLFAAVQRADRDPLLIFCRAGVDRTGLVVALLLAAADVDRRRIARDFAASAGAGVDILRGHRRSLIGTPMSAADRRRRLREVAADIDAAVSGYRSSCPPEAILFFLDAVDRRYAGAARLLGELGLDADGRQAVHAALRVSGTSQEVCPK